MTPKKIVIELKSATTFGRGDGVAGLIDYEVEHDKHGFPYLRGKTIKGLLAESAENVLFSMGVREDDKENPWRKAKERLFGVPGRGSQNERGILHIGNAQLPENLRAHILASGLSKYDVLYSLTGIRRHTAINPNGAPDDATLRSMRVLLPGIILEAPIDFENQSLGGDELQIEYQLLNVAVLDFRHAGIGRNRGRGWLTATLDDEETTHTLFQKFAEAYK